MVQIAVEESLHDRPVNHLLTYQHDDTSSFIICYDVGSEELNSTEIDRLHGALREHTIDDEWGIRQHTTMNVSPLLTRLILWWPIDSAWVESENHT